MLIDAAKASLLIIDMQERLLPAMTGADRALQRCQLLLTAARQLDVPVTASAQYPKGLGPIVEPIHSALGNAPVFEKTAFSCWRDGTLKGHLTDLHERGRPQVIIAGIEAHVCVLQTAIDLAQAGFAVHAVADAVASRASESVNLALERMRHDGVEVINTEMAVFELLERAGTPQFKALSQLVR